MAHEIRRDFFREPALSTPESVSALSTEVIHVGVNEFSPEPSFTSLGREPRSKAPRVGSQEGGIPTKKSDSVRNSSRREARLPAPVTDHPRSPKSLPSRHTLPTPEPLRYRLNAQPEMALTISHRETLQLRQLTHHDQGLEQCQENDPKHFWSPDHPPDRQHDHPEIYRSISSHRRGMCPFKARYIEFFFRSYRIDLFLVLMDPGTSRDRCPKKTMDSAGKLSPITHSDAGANPPAGKNHAAP